MKYPYSFGSAVGYSLILLVSLWWLPVVGPIIIGYVTGRKAGNPVKAVIAMAVPIFLYFLLVHLVAMGWVHVPHLVNGYFSGTVAGAVFVPYVKETFLTGMKVGVNLMSYLYYAPSAFFIMLTFAFIGGAMSHQIILERGLHPQPAATPRVKKNAAPKARTHAKSAPKKGKIKNVEKDKKFVVHEMDTKKSVPVKKKYGITFL